MSGLTKDQFDVLYSIYKRTIAKRPVEQVGAQGAQGSALVQEGTAPQEQAAAELNPAVVESLVRRTLLNAGQTLTAEGLAALAPYQVKNAIILAAGMSTRFVPFSYEKPKGLMVCRGEVLIERQIEQLLEAGVPEIVVVVGYKKEQFEYLVEKYGVTLVVNDDYVDRNNNGSIWAARDYLGKSYICASDNYFTYNVFESHVFRSFYDSVYAQGSLDERGLFYDEDGRIYKTERPTKDKWLMFGKSYIDEAFAKHLLEIIGQNYNNPEIKSYLWEWIYNDHIDEFDLYIEKYPEDTILEFDSLDDLREFDDYYLKHSGSVLLDKVCLSFNCAPAEISKIQPVKDLRHEKAFSFEYRNERYIYTDSGGVNKMN